MAGNSIGFIVAGFLDGSYSAEAATTVAVLADNEKQAYAEALKLQPELRFIGTMSEHRLAQHLEWITTLRNEAKSDMPGFIVTGYSGDMPAENTAECIPVLAENADDAAQAAIDSYPDFHPVGSLSSERIGMHLKAIEDLKTAARH